jgi:hypothetical protein
LASLPSVSFFSVDFLSFCISFHFLSPFFEQRSRREQPGEAGGMAEVVRSRELRRRG